MIRRASLTQSQANELAGILRTRRRQLGLSMRYIESMTGFNVATISGLEKASNLTPQPGTLKGIAHVLNLSVSDLYVITGWLPAAQLPAVMPYLRAKYRELPDEALAEVEALIATLRVKHGLEAPHQGEAE
jgi:transcriptional regulator with XRE-family HTH domain